MRFCLKLKKEWLLVLEYWSSDLTFRSLSSEVVPQTHMAKKRLTARLALHWTVLILSGIE